VIGYFMTNFWVYTFFFPPFFSLDMGFTSHDTNDALSGMMCGLLRASGIEKRDFGLAGSLRGRVFVDTITIYYLAFSGYLPISQCCWRSRPGTSGSNTYGWLPASVSQVQSLTKYRSDDAVLHRRIRG
jgi:hypothetical protein